MMVWLFLPSFSNLEWLQSFNIGVMFLKKATYNKTMESSSQRMN